MAVTGGQPQARETDRILAAHGAGRELRLPLTDARAVRGELRHVMARGTQAVAAWASDALFLALSLTARSGARSDPPTPLVCMPPAVCGRWFTPQAEPLDADGAGDAATVLQGAAGDLVMPSFCAWYGLTPRERAVVGPTAPREYIRGTLGSGV
ncbi:hypothetical protein ACIGFK_16755 [Streptomyces sp. NPDC085524]|uniref:hypothetical protein n=1 Tax=Streptomyces sp. NPDC085524 TaxID=3365728 RepID=UPI0037CF9F47